MRQPILAAALLALALGCTSQGGGEAPQAASVAPPAAGAATSVVKIELKNVP